MKKIIFMCMAVGVITSGCALGGKVPPQVGGVGSRIVESVMGGVSVGRSGWAFHSATLGVAGSLFAVFLGAGKFGWAGRGASVGTAVFSIVVAQYSWLVGILGLAVGVIVMWYGLKKNQENKAALSDNMYSLIEGFQAAKEEVLAKPSELRRELNYIMGKSTTAEVKTLVANWKKEKGKNDGN